MIALAVVMLHVVIGIKIVIALVIPDVPFLVQEREFRRTKVEQTCVRDLLELKYRGGHKDFKDMNDELQREAAEFTRAQIQD